MQNDEWGIRVEMRKLNADMPVSRELQLITWDRLKRAGVVGSGMPRRSKRHLIAAALVAVMACATEIAYEQGQQEGRKQAFDSLNVSTDATTEELTAAVQRSGSAFVNAVAEIHSRTDEGSQAREAAETVAEALLVELNEFAPEATRLRLVRSIRGPDRNAVWF